jgi:hypothetical protein
MTDPGGPKTYGFGSESTTLEREEGGDDYRPVSCGLLNVTLYFCKAVLRIRIRIHRIHVFLVLHDPDPDPLVRGMDPDPDPALDPDPDPSIIMQKYKIVRKTLIPPIL